jgi:hypothetical protein
MGKKQPRRKKLRHPRAESLAARASGFVINESRRGTLIRLMDTAILDWFLERDPFAIHFLVCGCYMVLADLGKKSGAGPRFEKRFGRFDMTAVYDFLRHAKPDLLNDSVDFPPVVNEWLLFDAIESFRRLFNGTSAFMRTFQAYFMLDPSGIDPKPLERVLDFFPEGVTVEEAKRLASLSRIAFFAEVSEMFAQDILRERDEP